MNNIIRLTNAYLYQLARTDIDSKTYAEIDAFLKDKLDRSVEDPIKTPSDRAKAILMDKLLIFPGVDKIAIHDDSGFQIGGIGMQANGSGPVTILIIDEGK